MQIGIDTGGTFTDLVGWDRGRLITCKVPSTPSDFSQGVLIGLQQLRGSAGGPCHITHATTVATNTLLERTGARTALITTKGCRDVLEIGRQARPMLYDFRARRPPPLVGRKARLEVTERVSAHGTIITPLDDVDIESTLDRVVASGAESLAICLLFSFLYPDHERRIAAAARRRGMPVTTSSELLPEFREFERTSTTVVNAFVTPRVQHYVRNLDGAFQRGRIRNWRIVQSNGGSLQAHEAVNQAARTLLSGPAAGVMGAIHMARAALPGRRPADLRLVTFDMGGTSTDVALVDGRCAVTTSGQIAGHPVHIPMMDIHTVGAGGGSIAALDSGGALQVGPRSAGADPGPACYGRGVLPTVTDANVVLGRVDPQRFLDGRLILDPSRSRTAVGTLAESAGWSVRRAAQAVVEVVTANMARAVRVMSTARGRDLREYTLVSFGGAGGLHACELAEAVGLRRVLIPMHPGVLSAFGAAGAAVVVDRSRTIMQAGTPAGLRHLHRVERELTREVTRVVRRNAAKPDQAVVTTSVDLRYAGQSFELSVPYCGDLAAAHAAFHREHARRYGHAEPGDPIELVTVRVCATAAVQPLRLRRLERGSPGPSAAARRSGRSPHSYDRELLLAGNRFRGPARVFESFASTYVPRGWTVTVDPWGHLLIARTT